MVSAWTHHQDLRWLMTSWQIGNDVIKPINFIVVMSMTLRLFMKHEDVNHIHKLLNKFDRNLRLTVDVFNNKVLRSLDLEMAPGGIFRKDICKFISDYM